MANAIILRATYGYRVAAENDPLVNLFERVSDNFLEAVQFGKWMVDIVPPRKYSHDFTKRSIIKAVPGSSSSTRLASRYRIQEDRTEIQARQPGTHRKAFGFRKAADGAL